MTKSAFPPALIGGLGAAILLLTVFGALLTPLPILFIGLSWGMGASIVSAAICMLAIGVVENASTAIDAMIAFILPSVMIIHTALQKDDDGKFFPADGQLYSLMMYSSSMALVLLVLFSQKEGGLVGTVTDFVLAHDALRFAITSLLGETADSPRIPILIRFSLIILPAIWMLIMIANMIGAQALARMTGLNLRPTPRYYFFALPASWELVLPVLMILSFFLKGAAQDAALVLTSLFIAAYMLLGLAVAHVYSLSWPLRGFWLGMIYAFLVVFLWFALVMAAVGMLESRFKLRYKWAKNDW